MPGFQRGESEYPKKWLNSYECLKIGIGWSLCSRDLCIGKNCQVGSTGGCLIHFSDTLSYVLRQNTEEIGISTKVLKNYAVTKNKYPNQQNRESRRLGTHRRPLNTTLGDRFVAKNLFLSDGAMRLPHLH
jgi:hypothetical protein